MRPRKHDLRTLLFLLILLTGLTCMALPSKDAHAAPPGARAAKASHTTGCLSLRPGQGLGEVSLGMSWSALKALQKKRKYKWTREGDGPVYQVGPYRVLLKGKGNARKVSFVDMRFTQKTACFRLGTKTLRPKGSWYSLAAQMGSCGPVEMRTGGNVIQCAHKGVMLIVSRAPGFRIFVDAAKAPKISLPHCAGYIVRGGLLITAKAYHAATPSQHASLQLAPGKSYCFRRLLVTTQTKPKQIPTMGQCETYRRRGATIVFCNHAGLAFVFGGPHLVLTRIDAYHYKRLPLPTQYPPPRPKPSKR